MSFKPTISPKLDYYLKSSEIDHALLTHLDYASAGHIGFASSSDLTGYLKLNQSTPQTIINGVPLMTTLVDEYGSGNQLVNKNYCDSAHWLMPPIIEWYDPTGGLPPTPSVGDRYGADDTGYGWTEGYIYEWDGDSWVESEPEEGWMVWDLLEMILWFFFSGGWEEVGYDSYWSMSDAQIGLTGDKSGSFDLTTTGIGDFGSLVTPYAQVVTVAKSGADYDKIQDAIDSILDATTTKRYCVKVQSGVYTEAVTMKDYVDIQGAGRTNTIISGTSGTVLTFSATHCTVMDIGVNVNYGTIGADSQAIVSSGADSAFLRCDITVTKSAGDKLMTALAVSGGSFRMMECYFAYSITGATVGTALVQTAVSHTGASTIFLLHSNEIVMTCNDTNDELVGFSTVAGSAGTWLLENNIISITGNLTATGVWIYGTATGATIARNRITVSAAVAYGIYSESSGGTAVVDTRHNGFIITGAFNRIAYIGTGDTWNSTFDKITALGGYTDSLGTVNFCSSPSNGTMSITGTLGAGATTVTSLKIPQIGGTAGKFSIFQGGANTADLTYTLPTAYPVTLSGNLRSTTAGILSWDENVYLTSVTVHNLLSATHGDTVSASPVLGDLLYGDATPNWTKLAGNVTTTKKFLIQTGTGAISAVPAWDTLVDGDIPSALTGKTYNALTLTANADGFQIAGGTISRIAKFIGADIILTGSGTNTYTFPASTSTLASLTLSETFTNKVSYNGLVITANTGVVTTGTWNGTVIGDNYIASALTGKTYNALTLTANLDGFQISGGTTPRTAIFTGANITFTGAGSYTYTFPSKTCTLAATSDKLSVFASTTSAELAGVISDETGSGALVFSNSPVFTTPNIGSATGSISGNAATVTTNANLTGVITSVGNATSIASQTGTGTKFVVDTSPTLVTPVLGVATATSINGLYFKGTNVNGGTFVGYQAGNVDGGNYNTFIGYHAGLVHSSGSDIVAIGYETLVSDTGGAYNTAIGMAALFCNVVGVQNTAIGYNALFYSLGSGNVAIGQGAGAWETGSNKLFIDNQQRASEADGRVKALIYGVFDAATANQYININGALNTLGAINKVTITAPATSATLTLITGSSLVTSGAFSLTLTTTATTVATFPAGTKTLLATDGSIGALTGTILSATLGNSTIYIGTTGILLNRASGALTLAGITLTTPNIGTPSAGTLTSCTGLPAASVVAGSLVAAMEASDHGAAATDQIINVCYGTGAAPAANTTTEGTIYITYTP